MVMDKKYISFDNLSLYHDNMKNYITELFNEFLNTVVYPVGSIYISVNSTPPSELFGGTWEQIKDTFLLSAGDSYAAGSSGGNKLHNHKYGLQYGGYYRHIALEKNPNAGGLIYDSSGNITLATEETIENFAAPMNSSTTKIMATEDPSMSHYRTIGTTSIGSNMPPYLTVYVRKRIG